MAPLTDEAFIHSCPGTRTYCSVILLCEALFCSSICHEQHCFVPLHRLMTNQNWLNTCKKLPVSVL